MWPSRNTRKTPGTQDFPNTDKTPGTRARASEQAVGPPHLPERAKTPRHPALVGFEVLGTAGLKSACACGLVAEGP